VQVTVILQPEEQEQVQVQVTVILQPVEQERVQIIVILKPEEQVLRFLLSLLLHLPPLQQNYYQILLLLNQLPHHQQIKEMSLLQIECLIKQVCWLLPSLLFLIF